MRNTKVGPSAAPSSRRLIVEAAKRLDTINLASSAARSDSQGVLNALQKYAALKSCLDSREGSEEIAKAIDPLTASILMAKTLVRCECEYDMS